MIAQRRGCQCHLQGRNVQVILIQYLKVVLQPAFVSQVRGEIRMSHAHFSIHFHWEWISPSSACANGSISVPIG